MAERVRRALGQECLDRRFGIGGGVGGKCVSDHAGVAGGDLGEQRLLAFQRQIVSQSEGQTDDENHRERRRDQRHPEPTTTIHGQVFP